MPPLSSLLSGCLQYTPKDIYLSTICLTYAPIPAIMMSVDVFGCLYLLERYDNEHSNGSEGETRGGRGTASGGAGSVDRQAGISVPVGHESERAGPNASRDLSL